MEKRRVFSLIYLSLLILAYTKNVVSTRSIIILAGQSNMAGRGGIINNTWDGVVPPECEPNPLILRFNKDLVWEEAREPLHRDIDYNGVCGVGPGMAFSNYVLKRNPFIGEIGLVPCAVGGTNISEWRRGTTLYNRLLTQAQAAVLDSRGGILRALLWYQGESDANSPEDAKLYKARLEQLFTDVRSDLVASSLPVIQVALASGGKLEYRNIVRSGQKESVSELPEVECVDANGLQLGPDGLHLTTAAQVRLGEMLADAFLQKY